jgi:hypothetical protein
VTRECAWRTDREVSRYLDLCLLGRASTVRKPALLLTAKGPKDLATRADDRRYRVGAERRTERRLGGVAPWSG